MRRAVHWSTGLSTILLLSACAERVATSVAPEGVLLNVAPSAVSSFASGGTFGDGSGPLVTPTLVDPSINNDAGLALLCPAPKKYFKINAPDGGWPTGYTVTLNGVTVAIRTDGGVEYLDWQAGAGVVVDFVRMKGGTGELVYDYNAPAATFDNWLTPPVNPRNGSPFGISHYVVCSEDDGSTGKSAVLAIEKTATTSWTRSWTWDISKSVDQPTQTIGINQSGTANYTVGVNGTSTDGDNVVSGSIMVSNAGDGYALINQPTDALAGATVTCAETFPYQLDPGATITCTYTATVPTRAAGENTATVTGTPEPGATINSPATSEPVPFSFSATPTTETNKCVNVTDVFNAGSPTLLGTVCGNDDGSATSQEFTYARTLTRPTTTPCGATTTFPNTAYVKFEDTILDEASASVVVTWACGCTPGFWSNARRTWPEGLSGSSKLGATAAFVQLPAVGGISWGPYASTTRTPNPMNSFTQAWGWSSGSTLDQMQQQMMRHAAAALLNSYAVSGYAYSTMQVRLLAQGALNSTDRAFVEGVKNALEAENERGCPLSNR
jgi:hypothetical protein